MPQAELNSFLFDYLLTISWIVLHSVCPFSLSTLSNVSNVYFISLFPVIIDIHAMSSLFFLIL